MKSFKTKILAVLLSLMMVFGIASPAFAGTLNAKSTSSVKNTSSVTIKTPSTQTKILNAVKKSSEFMLKNISNPTTGSQNGKDWQVFAVNRSIINLSGLNDWNKKYVDSFSDMSVLKYPSDYARAILVLSSMGKDVTDFNSTNLIEKMLESKDNVLSNTSNAIYALLALDCKDYLIPESCSITKDDIINYIVSQKVNENGEFVGSYEDNGQTIEYVDLDTTYMAIQALAPYYGTKNEAKEFVNKSLVSINKNQGKSGVIATFGTDNASTTAQALLAVVALDKDVNNYKIGTKTLIDGLLSLYDEKSGGFKYYGSVDLDFSTPQATYALAGYLRHQQGINGIYDFNNDKDITYPPMTTKLTLNKSSVYFTKAGATYKIGISSLLPNGAINEFTFKSSNNSIATVNSTGTVTAKNNGKTTITVSSADGSNVSAKLTVTVVISPKTVKASGGHKYAKVAYSKVSGATKYVIYKYNGKSYVKYATTTKTSFTDEKVTSGKNYYYKVRAYNGGYYSGYSKAVKAAVKVGIPTKVKAKSGKKKVTVTFKKVKYAKKYEIYKKSGKKYKKIATVKKNKYVDKKVKKNKKYYYKVRAVKDSSNKSNFSKTVKSGKVK
ncbi:Ig-like domain-containing protein [uncultured Anaerofustis sp.]|uniref:Ig-like domain-containing protein n=1 Tax=uncultured Anaerofustis sp. TaxID=904996 RepID=UPI0025CBEBCA|nr:Ig-like domain-containing protein [uncultured Anaerofustis sp.]